MTALIALAAVVLVVAIVVLVTVARIINANRGLHMDGPEDE